MLQNAYFLEKIGADTAENEQHFAEILPIGRRRPPGLRGRGSRAASGHRPHGLEPAVGFAGPPLLGLPHHTDIRTLLFFFHFFGYPPGAQQNGQDAMLEKVPSRVLCRIWW